jgi:hypothetical protein
MHCSCILSSANERRCCAVRCLFSTTQKRFSAVTNLSSANQRRCCAVRCLFSTTQNRFSAVTNLSSANQKGCTAPAFSPQPMRGDAVLYHAFFNNSE